MFEYRIRKNVLTFESKKIMIKALLISLGIYLIILFRKSTNLKKELREAESELLDVVEEELGNEERELLLSHTHWKGMPKYLLYYCYGTPNEEKTEETLDAIYETWYYIPIGNARSNARRKYQNEIYIENDIVTNSNFQATKI